jgi:hypothetical protein
MRCPRHHHHQRQHQPQHDPSGRTGITLTNQGDRSCVGKQHPEKKKRKQEKSNVIIPLCTTPCTHFAPKRVGIATVSPPICICIIQDTPWRSSPPSHDPGHAVNILSILQNYHITPKHPPSPPLLEPRQIARTERPRADCEWLSVFP